MTTRLQFSLVLAALSAAACGGHAAADPSAKPVRVAPPDAVVSCSEWVQRATADPELPVERVPAPIAFNPPPFPKRLPKGVTGKDGRAEVKVRVLIDTSGTADMKTFTVVKSTHPILTKSVRAAVAKWKFTPAEMSGCKVPRNFNGNWVTTSPAPKAGNSGAR